MASLAKSCTICFEDFLSTQFVKKDNITFSGDNALDTEKMTAIAAKCDHVFHEGCLAKWINEYKTKITCPPCPLCRVNLIEQPNIAIAPVNQAQLAQDLQLAQELDNPNLPADEGELPPLQEVPDYAFPHVQEIVVPLILGGLNNPLVQANPWSYTGVGGELPSLASVLQSISANAGIQMPSSQQVLSELQGGAPAVHIPLAGNSNSVDPNIWR